MAEDVEHDEFCITGCKVCRPAKEVLLLQEVRNKKLYTTYHVVSKPLAELIRKRIMEGSLNAFPTRAEAEALARK